MKNITDLQIVNKEEKIEPKKTTQEPPPAERKPKKSKKKKIIIILSILFIILASATAFFLWPKENNLSEVPEGLSDNEKIEISPLDTESPLNGVWTTKVIAKRRPIGIMIENHPDSRPQSSLDRAELVYEAVTEGGITRFLAFYVVNDVNDEIGPVRSARSYFVKFADEYNVFYAHVGGSADALSLISGLDDFYDLNQFQLSKYFWRDKNRYAPHNVYTTTNKLRKAGESKKYDTNAEYDKWSFKEDESIENRGETQKVTIDFSSSSYKIQYTYDKEKNEYKRNMAGKEHTDKNSKNQIKAKTVIVQYVKSWAKSQGIDLKNDGSGKAEIFMDGKTITGTWKKLGGRKDRTKFYDENGNEIELNRGPIWIEIASNGVKVTSE